MQRTIDLEVYFSLQPARSPARRSPTRARRRLADPKPRGHDFHNGHTDGIGGDAFNKKLSMRAAMIRQYLVDNFHLSAGNLRTVGYGKTRPKNKMDPNAPENRRVEVVNETARAQAQR